MKLFPGSNHLPRIRPRVPRQEPPFQAEVLEVSRRLALASNPTDKTNLQELQALGREPDARVFYAGLFNFALRLKEEREGEQAAVVFQYLDSHSASKLPEKIRSQAKEELELLSGRGPAGRRLAFFTENLLAETAEGRGVLPLMAGSVAFSLVRGMGGLSAAGWGLLAESSAIVLTQRALQRLGWEKDSPHAGSGLGDDFGHTLLDLGLFRLFGFAGRKFAQGLAPESSPWLHVLLGQASMLVGLKASQLLSGRGVAQGEDGLSLVADWARLNVAGALAHRLLGTGWQRFQHEIQLRSSSRPLASLRDLFPSPRLALAGGLPFIEASVFMTQQGEGGGKRDSSRIKSRVQVVLQEIRQNIDPQRRIKALRLIPELVPQCNAEEKKSLAQGIIRGISDPHLKVRRAALANLKKIDWGLGNQEFFELMELIIGPPESFNNETALEAFHHLLETGLIARPATSVPPPPVSPGDSAPLETFPLVLRFGEPQFAPLSEKFFLAELRVGEKLSVGRDHPEVFEFSPRHRDISRTHFTLIRDATGLSLFDGGDPRRPDYRPSSTGTRVNGRLLQPREQARLREEDVAEFGGGFRLAIDLSEGDPFLEDPFGVAAAPPGEVFSGEFSHLNPALARTLEAYETNTGLPLAIPIWNRLQGMAQKGWGPFVEHILHLTNRLAGRKMLLEGHDELQFTGELLGVGRRASFFKAMLAGDGQKIPVAVEVLTHGEMPPEIRQNKLETLRYFSENSWGRVAYYGEVPIHLLPSHAADLGLPEPIVSGSVTHFASGRLVKHVERNLADLRPDQLAIVVEQVRRDIAQATREGFDFSRDPQFMVDWQEEQALIHWIDLEFIKRDATSPVHAYYWEHLYQKGLRSLGLPPTSWNEKPWEILGVKAPGFRSNFE